MHTSVCPASLLSLRNDFLLDLMLVLMGTRIPMFSNEFATLLRLFHFSRVRESHQSLVFEKR